MSADGARLVQAARQYIGTPFRLHGRDPERGLDCVGLLVASLKSIGASASDPAGYGLRNRSIDMHLSHFEQSALAPVSGAIKAGDVLLVKPGPGQHHILICDGQGGFIHAHAGLRRIVQSPGPCPWPITGHFRALPSDKG